MKFNKIKINFSKIHFDKYFCVLGIGLDFSWLNIDFKQEKFIEHNIPINFLFWQTFLKIKLFYK